MITGLSTNLFHLSDRSTTWRLAVVFFLVSVFMVTASCQKREKGVYPNGQAKFLYYKNKEGKIEGQAQFWYENGKPELTAYYKNGKLDGTLTRYSEDGKMLTSDEYKAGVQDGISREYFPNGKVKTEMTYKNDVLDGLTRQFDESGQMIAEGNYKAGLYEGKWTYWDRFGHLIAEAMFTAGAGVMKSYDADGNVVGVTEFKNNVKHGPETWYSMDGKQTRTTWYIDGEPAVYPVQPEVH